MPPNLTHQSWPSGAPPLVSICCITYNHCRYIARCIEGFLLQQTTFPVEILIHDDASTDGTSDIVRDYEARYPHLIKGVYQTENQYSKGIKPNATFNFSRARGKYIALCDGDDAWVDPSKLETQISFLEGNPDYVVCHHNASKVDSSGHVLQERMLPPQFERDYDNDGLLLGPWLLTLTLCFRNILGSLPPEHAKVVTGDYFLITMLGLHGKAKYQFGIQPAIHTVHADGVWNRLSREAHDYERFRSGLYIHQYLMREADFSKAMHFFKNELMRAASVAFPESNPMSEKVREREHMLLERQEALLALKRSVSYKVGAVITWPLKSLFELLKVLLQKLRS